MKSKLWLTAITLLLFSMSASAQFTGADIKIYGLTCSLCSRSVEMALQKVDFVDDIKTDLETTLTTVTFKNGVVVAPEELARAVEKAGFSVGYIKVSYDFKKVNNTCAEGEGEAFTIINSDKDIASGTHDLLLVEKDMMAGKMYKEYKNNLPSPCETTKRHYYAALADQLILN